MSIFSMFPQYLLIHLTTFLVRGFGPSVSLSAKTHPVQYRTEPRSLAAQVRMYDLQLTIGT